MDIRESFGFGISASAFGPSAVGGAAAITVVVAAVAALLTGCAGHREPRPPPAALEISAGAADRADDELTSEVAGPLAGAITTAFSPDGATGSTLPARRALPLTHIMRAHPLRSPCVVAL
jgi:hypothetical protein